MNKKGQSLVIFIIILPIILLLFGLLIERVYLTYQKQKLYSVTKTIIAFSIERNDKNDIINLYKDNNIVLENIEIEDDNGLKIIASEKVPSLIKKEDYIIEVNIKGVKKEDKIIYQRG
ncbi:MAG: hypothetical protein PUD07_05020 [bacterium]|nr:hypothetical protein [bacterium]